MKKIISIIVISCLVSLGLYSQTYIRDTFNFEGSITVGILQIDSNTSDTIWQIGSPDKILFDSSFSQPNAIVTDTLNSYPSNDTFSFIIDYSIFNPSSSLQPIITFRYKLDLNPSDICIAEYLNPSGVWISALSLTEPQSNWTYGNIHLTHQGGIKKFRFNFISGSDTAKKDGWMIDDIIVWYSQWWGIEDLNEDDFMLYPNPSSTFISVEFDKPLKKEIQITLFNQIGNHILNSRAMPGISNLQLDIAHLPNGVYYLQFNTEDGKGKYKQLVVAR